MRSLGSEGRQKKQVKGLDPMFPPIKKSESGKKLYRNEIRVR